MRLVLSPCIKQCRLVDDKCSACNRTKEHITKWSSYTDETRLRIMKEISKGE